MDVNAKIFVPIHWGVFNLGRNPWKQSITRAAAEAQAKGVRLDAPKQGEKYHPDFFQTDKWWERQE